MSWRRLLHICLATGAVSIAFGGIAAAGAEAATTNLCNEGPNAMNKCPAGKAFGVGQIFEWEATNPVMKSTVLGDIGCASSKLKVELTELKAGAAAVGEVKELTFVATAKGLPYTIQFSQTGGGNAGLVITKAGGAKLEIEIKCGARMPCLYGNKKEFKPTMTGGNPAKIKFNEAWERFAGPCGAIKFEAEYLATSPTAVWATE